MFYKKVQYKKCFPPPAESWSPLRSFNSEPLNQYNRFLSIKYEYVWPNKYINIYFYIVGSVQSECTKPNMSTGVRYKNRRGEKKMKSPCLLAAGQQGLWVSWSWWRPFQSDEATWFIKRMEHSSQQLLLSWVTLCTFWWFIPILMLPEPQREKDKCNLNVSPKSCLVKTDKFILLNASKTYSLLVFHDLKEMIEIFVARLIHLWPPLCPLTGRPPSRPC